MALIRGCPVIAAAVAFEFAELINKVINEREGIGASCE
jgi:hypothetical protein